MGDFYAFYVSKCQADWEEEKERRRRMRRTLLGRCRVLCMILIRERKRRRKGREPPRAMSMMSGTACILVLLRRKRDGEQAETRLGEVRRLGELRLPERCARLEALRLNAGDVVAERRSGPRNANGESIASELGMS